MHIRFSQSVTVLALSLFACTAARRVSERDLQSRDSDVELLSVQRKDKTLLDFSKDQLGYAILRDSVIYRQQPSSAMEIIPIDQVDLSTAYRRTSATEDTTTIVLLSAGGVVLLFFLLSSIQFPSF